VESYRYAHFFEIIITGLLITFKIAATRNCRNDICETSVSIEQGKYPLKLNPDFTTEYNGYKYSVAQVIKR